MKSEIIWVDALARDLSISEDAVYELARTKQLPFAVSTGHPRRLFIATRDLRNWRDAIRDEEAT